ncbi:MAG: phospholipid carrier-dependent glycosyltransferase [Deltaproteobacteria bacterium]|nr:phospholipid carrier-dependent glycosyltransferase [Deltaproteobacteria bacterium]
MKFSSRFRAPYIALGIGLVVVGAVVRTNNAFQYPPLWGFDARGNWQYVASLLSSWALPAPESGWSTGHPPLFYYLSACVGRLFSGDRDVTVVAVRLMNSLAGLATAGLAAWLVHRSDPERPSRALLAAALLIFLPVQIMLSAMFTEEILVSFLISTVVVGLALGAADRGDAGAGPGPSDGPGEAWLAMLGVMAGLACSTKLSGALVVLVATLTLAIRGLDPVDLRRTTRHLAIFGVPVLLFGGAYYARNWFEYGFVYPHGLGPHAVMQEMPPGSRELLDFFRFPLAVWTDPQLLSPDLLRSVWGSTYTTWWFDGIRKFLPVDGALVGTLGTAMLVLAVVPTAAGIAGLVSGVRRAFRRPDGLDTPLLLLVAATIAGYALFNWRNQVFATLKASYLLGLSVPFAYYTSEGLDRWMRRSTALRVGVLGALVALFVLTVLVFSYGLLFTKAQFAGIDWRQVLH